MVLPLVLEFSCLSLSLIKSSLVPIIKSDSLMLRNSSALAPEPKRTAIMYLSSLVEQDLYILFISSKFKESISFSLIEILY